MCKYCTDNGMGTRHLILRELTFGKAFIGHLHANIERENGYALVVQGFNSWGKMFSYRRHINYCPICGRKLEK